MAEVTDTIVRLVREALEQEVEVPLSTPPDSAMGDYSVPCFRLAKGAGMAPVPLAQRLRDALLERDLADFGITRVDNHGPYLNFHLARGDVASRVIGSVLREGAGYGSGGSGTGERALVEHTSINPNASPHLGRARNAWIGDTLVRLLRFEGYDIEVRFFVNDVGRQIALLVLGVGDRNPGFNELLQIYVEANRRLQADPGLGAQVTQLLERLESGDAATRAAFRRVVEISVRGMREVFADADVRYDSFDYESDYLTPERSRKLVEQLRSTGRLFEDEHGRLVLNLEGFELPSRNPVLVITRGNKTSLYVLRDMAYTLDKVAAAADLNLVVLGEDQKLYHRQLQAALSLLGTDAPAPVHYSFVLLGEGSMSSRQGNLVLLEDFVAEAKRKAAAELQARGHAADPAVAKAVAYSALKYSFLRVANDKQVVFNWDQAMSFEGESGPYLLYSHARICSVLRKYGKELPAGADFTALTARPEVELIKLLDAMPDQVARALRIRSPHVLANYAFAVARQFSTFYHACPILQEAAPLREARLLLAAATRQVLANCLRVMGIEPLQRM
ncbi:MAG: arginine--tRNA ligase [Spirochaetaceae bacterium]|nr:arginine--tRNA ligase [Spirochaetaceae bacterium]